ncbi:MAG: sarcosine oxidase subunit gamma [Variibacter sp.]
MSDAAATSATAMPRRGPLAGLDLDTRVAGVALADAGPCARFLLRGGGAAALAAGMALNLDMPREAYGCVTGDAGRAALWLGPDEWMLVAPEADADALAQNLAAALNDLAHALTDISHRNAGLIVRGPMAADAINAGCPLDLDIRTFPVGACARTLLAKAEIVLWRIEADAFRVETTRSFAPYVVALLQQAARDQD